jgi:hypothetical protein
MEAGDESATGSVNPFKQSDASAGLKNAAPPSLHSVT